MTIAPLLRKQEWKRIGACVALCNGPRPKGQIYAIGGVVLPLEGEEPLSQFDARVTVEQALYPRVEMEVFPDLQGTLLSLGQSPKGMLRSFGRWFDAEAAKPEGTLWIVDHADPQYQAGPIHELFTLFGRTIDPAVTRTYWLSELLAEAGITSQNRALFEGGIFGADSRKVATYHPVESATRRAKLARAALRLITSGN